MLRVLWATAGAIDGGGADDGGFGRGGVGGAGGEDDGVDVPVEGAVWDGGYGGDVVPVVEDDGGLLAEGLVVEVRERGDAGAGGVDPVPRGVVGWAARPLAMAWAEGRWSQFAKSIGGWV